MRTSSSLAAVLLAALLAGCAAQPAPPPAAPPATPTRVELTGCTGWSLERTFPDAAAPGTPPRGWEGGNPNGLASVHMAAYACHRLSLGVLERPARLLFDAHDHAAIPASCMPRGDEAGEFVLNSLWTDDAAVAAALNRSYGLPVRVTTMDEQAQDAGPAQVHSWSGAGSALTVADDGHAMSSGSGVRLFWPHGAGVAVLELTFDLQQPAHGGQPAHGTFQPPLLLAGPFAGEAIWQTGFAASGTFTLYADRNCTQPEAWP